MVSVLAMASSSCPGVIAFKLYPLRTASATSARVIATLPSVSFTALTYCPATAVSVTSRAAILRSISSLIPLTLTPFELTLKKSTGVDWLSFSEVESILTLIDLLPDASEPYSIPSPTLTVTTPLVTWRPSPNSLSRRKLPTGTASTDVVPSANW